MPETTGKYWVVMPEFHHTDPQSIRDFGHRLDPSGTKFDDWTDLALALMQYEEQLGSKLKQEILVVLRGVEGFFVAWIPDAAAYYHYRASGYTHFGYYAVERGEVLSNVVRYKAIKEWRPTTNHTDR